MSVRAEVSDLVRLGPLPDSGSVDKKQAAWLRVSIERISAPLTRDEATLLLGVFGPDSCHGLAWLLLKLIESAPGGAPLDQEPDPGANEWVRFLWKRARRPRPTDPVSPAREARRAASDSAILEELATLPGLPDEDDPAWDDERTWNELAYVFLALADLAAERRLRAALPLLLARASYGDPGEIMRGLRHALEAIVLPDVEPLIDACIEAATSTRAGTRLWAVDELRVIRDPRTLPVLIHSLSDERMPIRRRAQDSLLALCQDHPGCRAPSLRALRQFLATSLTIEETDALKKTISTIQALG